MRVRSAPWMTTEVANSRAAAARAADARRRPATASSKRRAPSAKDGYRSCAISASRAPSTAAGTRAGRRRPGTSSITPLTPIAATAKVDTARIVRRGDGRHDPRGAASRPPPRAAVMVRGRTRASARGAFSSRRTGWVASTAGSVSPSKNDATAAFRPVAITAASGVPIPVALGSTGGCLGAGGAAGSRSTSSKPGPGPISSPSKLNAAPSSSLDELLANRWPPPSLGSPKPISSGASEMPSLSSRSRCERSRGLDRRVVGLRR